MKSSQVDHEHWARLRKELEAWARSPNHDAFWAYRQSFISFLGRAPGQRWTLDVARGVFRAD